MRRIYLDHNATSPLHPAAREAAEALLGETFGNPSSLHWFGQRARRELDAARQKVAAALGAQPDEVVFTSGGTEADNLALWGAARAMGAKKGATGAQSRIVTSTVEHQAVRSTCAALADAGLPVILCPVDSRGVVDKEALLRAVGPGTLVSLILASSDLGTLQPVAALAPEIHARGGSVHTDAVQALGKIPLVFPDLGVDYLALSAHKVGGPKGVGALVVRRGAPLASLLHGGHQERNRRAGTENLPGIAGFGAACEVAVPERLAAVAEVSALRDQLQARILDSIPDTQAHGHLAERVSNTLCVTFGGVAGETLVMALDLAGVAASTGAACMAGLDEPSYVLEAIGVPPERRRSALRLSLGPDTSPEELDQVAGLLPALVARLRQGGDGHG